MTRKISGMESLIGKTVTIFCANYVYTGKLLKVSADCVRLASPKIVYETGAFNDKQWKDAQDLPGDWFVSRGLIESFGILK